MSERSVRVFVSSPADAMAERRRVEAVAERLNGEFERRVKIEVIRWETSFYSAHETFQQQIPEAANCDVVIAVFRARLGTELPRDFKKKLPNGDSYPSGTAYEVLSAIEARQNDKPLPDIYVFRCAVPPSVELDDPNAPAIRAEWERLKGFFDTWFRTPDGQFLAAFQNFTSTDDFAVKLEECLRQWLIRHGLIEQGQVWDRALKGPPFPGLVPYDAPLEGVFFGRDLDIAHALEHLRDAGEKGLPFLLLIGASDAGKSSLMRAGILPQLVRPATIPEIDLWRKALVIPGVDPLLSLARAMFADDALGHELAGGDFTTPEMLAKLFAAGDADASIAPIRTALGRAAAARAARMRFAEPRPARLVLGVDQAERLLLETDPAVADIFAQLLSALVKNRLAYVIVALRSDAYPRFQQIDALRELRTRGATFDLVPPGNAELEEIVTRPIAACRPPLKFEVKDGRTLSDLLVSDAKGPDMLPLLQMALARLFKAEAERGDGELRFADYPGLGQAVSQTAQDVLMTLDSEAQAQLPGLILALVSDVVAEPGTDALIPAVTGFERSEFERNKPARTKLVDAFIAHRLLVTEERGEMLRARPAHEALLRIWPEAVKIIAANVAVIRVRHVLQPIVREWAAAPEAHKGDYAALPPALLAGARQAMEVCGDDLAPDMRNFIARALELDAARREQEVEQRADHERAHTAEVLAASEQRLFRRTVAGLAAVALLAVVAVVQWHDAQTERRLAETRLIAAVKTANSLVSDFAYRLRNTSGVPIALVDDILNRVSRFQDELEEVSPQLLQSKADAQGELASTLLILGDTGRALNSAQEARNIYRNLVKGAPDDVAFQLGLSWSDKKVGDVLLARGDLSGAYDAYSDSVAIARTHHAKDAANADWQHDLVESENKLGDVLRAQRKIADARAIYEQALNIAMVPVGGGADHQRWQSDLAWSYSKIGDVDMLEHKIEDARASYYNSLEQRKDLAAKDASNTEWQHDVWISYNKFGDALMAEEDFKNAYDTYAHGRDIAEALSARDENNTAWRHDLSMSYVKIGNVLRAQNKLEEARAAYRKSAAIDEALVARDADNVEWRIDLIEVNWDLAKLGDDAPTRFDFVISQLKRLQSENKLAPDKADWLTRAEADRAKLVSQ
jgi:tetratricopeptide (TPR) repeat protein